MYKGSWHGDVAVKMLRVSQQATEEHTADLRREVAMLMYVQKTPLSFANSTRKPWLSYFDI